MIAPLRRWQAAANLSPLHWSHILFRVIDAATANVRQRYVPIPAADTTADDVHHAHAIADADNVEPLAYQQVAMVRRTNLAPSASRLRGLRTVSAAAVAKAPSAMRPPIVQVQAEAATGGCATGLASPLPRAKGIHTPRLVASRRRYPRHTSPIVATTAARGPRSRQGHTATALPPQHPDVTPH